MAGAVLSFPYMGILAILLMTMTLEADALTAWDCSRDGLESRTVFLKDLSEGEKSLVESMRTSGFQYPDELAYKIKREPGYTAILEEDKIHIVQCKPVVALVLPQDKCYDRLQVVYHDNIFFLTPWTHIITETANEISCDAPNLRDYELEGSTYKIVPRPGVSLKPRRDKNFEEDPVNSSPKLTPKYKETEYLRRRNIGGIDTVSKESIESYMYKLQHPELDLEPRRDKNFEEDPVNSSPKLTPKYKETEYLRRRNIGGIDTVSKESIESYMYKLQHPELDLEPRRDKNFEEDPVNSSPKLTPKYKETEYLRRRNIGGIDTVSKESIESYMYKLQHPELDLEPRRDKNFEEDPVNSSPKLTPKYKETEYLRRRNIGGIDTVSKESIESYMYKLQHPELDLEPRRDKNFEEDPVNSSPKLTPKYKETEYLRRRNIGGIDTVSKESIESYMYRLQHPELDLEPRRDKSFEEDPVNSSPKLTPKYKETEYLRRRNIGGIDTVSKESIELYMYRLEHPELDLEPRRDKNFEEDPVNSSPKLMPKYKETEYRRRRNIDGIDTVSKELIELYNIYRLEHPELDDQDFPDEQPKRRPILTVADEPEKRPILTVTEETKRRPILTVADEPEKRPVLTVAEETKRRPILTVADEPEKRPVLTVADEPEKRPVLTVVDEPEKRPVLTVADEHKRIPILTVADEPERRPVLTVADEPEKRPVLTVADEHEIPCYKNMDISFLIYVFIGALLIPSILVIFSVMLVGCIKYGFALYFFRRENRGHLHTNQPLHISPDLNLKQNKETVKIAYNRI